MKPKSRAQIKRAENCKLTIERKIVQKYLGRLHPKLGIDICAKGRMWCHLVVFLECTNPAANESRGHLAALLKARCN